MLVTSNPKPVNGNHQKVATLPCRVKLLPPNSPLKGICEKQHLQNKTTEREHLLTPAKIVDKCVDALSTPRAIIIEITALGAYLGVNLLNFSLLKFDPPPFLLLNTILAVSSTIATVFVLNSNRRQDIEAKKQDRIIKDATHKILDRLEHIEKHLNLNTLDKPEVVVAIKHIDPQELVRKFRESKL